jgi:peptidoglycan L-alanyl-D-glutamate endopeptidase CwlK
VEIVAKYKFSRQSLERLEGVHPLLIDVSLKILQYWDCKIVYGLRSHAEQARLYSEGLSKTMNSLHLKQEDGYGHALDIAPYPIDWNDTNRFYYFAGIVKPIADDILKPHGWYLRWGGNWDGDLELDDQTFMDLVHFEIRRGE